MFETLCNLVFRSDKNRWNCESVLRELAEQGFIHMPEGTPMAKRYVVYMLRDAGVLRKEKHGRRVYWVADRGWLDSMARAIRVLRDAG